jgi:hypothetical protein
LVAVDVTGGEHSGEVVEPRAQRRAPGVWLFYVDAFAAVRHLPRAAAGFPGPRDSPSTIFTMYSSSGSPRRTTC